jgi:hypothetical protein
MDTLKRSIAVALAMFGASLVGMLLQHVVPAQALTDSKGTVGAMVGLVTLLLALVLGLLVFTAFAVYTTQRDQAQGLAQVVIELDLALERYGPEAAPGRAGLRAALARSAMASGGHSSSPSRKPGRRYTGSAAISTASRPRPRRSGDC